MIETARLLLRQWTDADRAPFAALSADPEVMRFYPAPSTAVDADAAIDRAAAHIAVHGWGMWAVARRDDQGFVGKIGLQPCNARGPLFGEVEIGWRVARPLWRQGYAREAAQAVLDWSRGNLHRRIVAYTAAINAPSAALMARLGMTRRTDLDFAHHAITIDSPLRPHIVFVKEAP